LPVAVAGFGSLASGLQTGGWKVRSLCPENEGCPMRGDAGWRASRWRRALRGCPGDIAAACLSQVGPQRAWALHRGDGCPVGCGRGNAFVGCERSLGFRRLAWANISV